MPSDSNMGCRKATTERGSTGVGGVWRQTTSIMTSNFTTCSLSAASQREFHENIFSVETNSLCRGVTSLPEARNPNSYVNERVNSSWSAQKTQAGKLKDHQDSFSNITLEQNTFVNR